jgi:CAAX prenyl protease-like protein
MEAAMTGVQAPQPEGTAPGQKGLLFAYTVPFAVYLGLTQVPAAFPEHYAWMYSAVVVVTSAVTLVLVRGRRLWRPHFHIVPGVAFGVVGIVLWIVLCQLQLESRLAAWLPEMLRPQARAAFDPWTSIAEPGWRWAFLGFRFVGLVLLVPVVEELFWRGFLLRWLNAPNWQQQKLGQFTPFSCGGVVLLFTLVHPEWLAAAVYCVLLNGLLYWKKDLWNCLVAHGVSNLILAIYILCTGHWELW